MANLYGSLQDTDAWGDPENFRPERFLSSDGITLVRNEAFISFSVGKRFCLGETLARDSIFLWLSAILQSFEVLNEAGKPMPSMEPCFINAGVWPVQYNVVMRERV
jgi:methyl farnesoate epoxidase/farnesoate epoxidase